MLKVKAKFNGETFKRAVSVTMLGLMTATTIYAGNTDKNTVTENPATTEQDYNSTVTENPIAAKQDYDVTSGHERTDLGVTTEEQNYGETADHHFDAEENEHDELLDAIEQDQQSNARAEEDIHQKTESEITSNRGGDYPPEFPEPPVPTR